MTNQIQPVFILPEGTMRNTGKSAQKMNIAAAKAVAETVRSTLGPKGMDKMLVDGMNDVVITNDGATILSEMSIEHPAAKMLVEVAKVQETEVGDGTTTAVILAGELLSNAEKLLDRNIHPTIITKGYKLAAEKAIELLNPLGKKITLNNRILLEKIAMTAMTGKNVEWAREKLAKISVDAILNVIEETDKEFVINLDNIKLQKKDGGSIEDSEMIRGIVLDKEKVHPDMPSKIQSARIALLDCPIEIRETTTDAKISLTDPMQLQSFIEQEEKILKMLVEKVVKSKANVVFCQKGIDDLAQHYLAKQNILAVRRIKQSDIEALAKATGGRIISNLDDLRAEELGFAGLVEEKRDSKSTFIFVKECKNPKAVSVIVRGSTEHVVAEVERSIIDALGDLSASIKLGKCVTGGGAVEIELSRQLRSYSDSLSGKESLAIQAFSEALESIPKTLAENAGLDPIDCLAELKARHDKGEKDIGLDLNTGAGKNLWDAGVIEPLKIKTQAIQSATDVAVMLLRIDDVISSDKKSDGPKGMPQAMPEY